MAIQPAEKERFGIQIMQDLSKTPYACSSLAILSGGTANFLFRGSLIQPLHNGAKTIIVKHSKEYVSANRDFPLDISRCIFEETLLNALRSFQQTTIDNISLKTPRLYQFDRKTNTQILEDLADMTDLKTVLVSPTVSSVLPQPISATIGHALGVWLQSFHSWASEPAQAELHRVIANNTPMRKIRYAISYGAFTDVIQKSSDIWQANRKALEEVRDMAVLEYAKLPGDDLEENWGIIHGDFWTGNVLIPNDLSLEKQRQGGINLFIIDWELAQFGRKEYDLGQMIGDLYERKHFNGTENALWIIQGFVAGYGVLSDDMAFRVAIHAGVHIIGWYIRRNPSAPFKEPPEQIREAIRVGTDFIVKGWEKNRKWFEASELRCLFKEC
jgi:hypothetical protein